MGNHALRKMVKHLEFLGYRAEAQDDGWTFVSHPTRPDFFLRDFPLGIRAVAMFTLDRVVCDQEWLAFVNKCSWLRSHRPVHRTPAPWHLPPARSGQRLPVAGGWQPVGCSPRRFPGA